MLSLEKCDGLGAALPPIGAHTVSQLATALLPGTPGEDVSLRLARVLSIVKGLCEADVAIALQQVDELTASALASVPCDALPDGLTTPAIFAGAVSSGQSVYHIGDVPLPAIPRIAHGATAIIPWLGGDRPGHLDTPPGAVVLVRHRLAPFTPEQRGFLDSLRGLFYTLVELHHLALRAEERSVFFDAIVKTLPHGLLFIDDSGAKAWINAPAASMLGIQEGSVPPHQVAPAMRELRARADNHQRSPSEWALF